MATQLLTSNRKLDKAAEFGYMSAGVFMEPSDKARAGHSVCYSEKAAGCRNPCINTSGTNIFAVAQAAQRFRTLLYLDHRRDFYSQVIEEVKKFEEKAARAGLKPSIRLNGYSDISHERNNVMHNGRIYENIFDIFPHIQFLDYTKNPHRFRWGTPSNYHLTFSYSPREEFRKFYEKAVEYGAQNYAAVFRNASRMPAQFLGLPVIDGDTHDLRFMDPVGVTVGLVAKGRGRKDCDGFIIEN